DGHLAGEAGIFFTSGHLLSPSSRPEPSAARRSGETLPASGKAPRLRSGRRGSLLDIPLDSECIAPSLDIPGIGAWKMGGAEQGAAFGAILQQLAPALRRQFLVRAKLARPVGVI